MQFITKPQKFRAYVGGFGAGKTWVGCTALSARFCTHPTINQGYFAPTYPHIRDIFYPTIEEVASGLNLNVQINQGNKEVHFYRGYRSVGTTICRTLSKPEQIVGFKIGAALIDELDIMSPPKAQLAWRKIIARMRWEGALNQVDVTTTPEGFRETHRLFVEELQRKPELKSLYSIIHASTYDNEKNLPEGYIDSLVQSYPSELIDAYIDGNFCNLTIGTVYRKYNRIAHESKYHVEEGEKIFVGMDFNVGNMAAVIFVRRGCEWHAVDEIKKLIDTPAMGDLLLSRYPNNPAIIYPDASGNSRKTNNASTSDLNILRNLGFEIRAMSSNPLVKNRVHSVNKQFEDNRLFVNTTACPTLANCLERQSYDANGEPDKSSGFDHQNDAFGYAIAYECPILTRSPIIQTINLPTVQHWNSYER